MISMTTGAQKLADHTEVAKSKNIASSDARGSEIWGYAVAHINASS
jgi:hypothetical protein